MGLVFLLTLHPSDLCAVMCSTSFTSSSHCSYPILSIWMNWCAACIPNSFTNAGVNPSTPAVLFTISPFLWTRALIVTGPAPLRMMSSAHRPLVVVGHPSRVFPLGPPPIPLVLL